MFAYVFYVLPLGIINDKMIVRSVSQRPNLRHLRKPQGGTEGMVKMVGFKNTTE